MEFLLHLFLCLERAANIKNRANIKMSALFLFFDKIIYYISYMHNLSVIKTFDTYCGLVI